MDAAVPNSREPDLRVRTTSQQISGGRQRVRGDVIVPAVYVQRKDLTVMARFDLWAQLLLVDGHSPAGMLFLGVARFSLHRRTSLASANGFHGPAPLYGPSTARVVDR